MVNCRYLSKEMTPMLKPEMINSLASCNIRMEEQEMIVDCGSFQTAYRVWENHRRLCGEVSPFQDVDRIKLKVQGKSLFPPFSCDI
jgi:hypothetical protein